MAYQLTNVDGKWWAEGTLESGRKVRFECGDGTKEKAEGVAEMKWKRKLQSSDASKRRWEIAAAKNGAPAPSSTRSSSTSPERAAQIRGKLLAMGDAAELDVDDDDDDDPDDPDDGAAGDAGDEKPEVFSSPEEAKKADGDEEEDEDAEEAAELLADVIGNGLYTGVTGTVTKVLKKAKPPRSPGEPHELFVKFGREGCCYRMRKLIGKGAKLSPNAKLFVGMAGTIVSMIWNSEVIEAAPAPTRQTESPAPAERRPPPAAAGSTSSRAAPPARNPPKLALVRAGAPAPDMPPDDPLGSFG